MRGAVLIVALIWPSTALAQNVPNFVPRSYQVEPELKLDGGKFALPIVDYRAPDGTWKRSSGIIIGHDISPNATIGLGFFRMTPKSQEAAGANGPAPGKSKKVSLGFSLRF